MIEKLLPVEVVAVEAFDDRASAPLYPEEAAVVARAVEKRRREFATVRRCARDALAVLGVPPAPIVPGERGAPGWPYGVVGSMTHCAGYRAAAVARSGVITAVGIDAEPHEALPAGVLDAIARLEERAALTLLPDGTRWDRLLFSAKESVYKAWYPLTGRWLDFEEATVDLDPGGAFDARIHVTGPVSAFRGQWCVANGLIMTAIATRAE